MAICADELMEQGRLGKNTVVATVMSNVALETFLEERGGSLVRTPVGDRYVVEEMRKRGCNFGGEKSGHIVCMDHTTTGDGTLAALQILAIMRRKQARLSELSRIIELYPQILINVRVAEKKPFENIDGFDKLIQASEKRLKARGRINLRYSGTESLARVMVEGESESLIGEIAERIASVLRKEIGD